MMIADLPEHSRDLLEVISTLGTDIENRLTCGPSKKLEKLSLDLHKQRLAVLARRDANKISDALTAILNRWGELADETNSATA